MSFMIEDKATPPASHREPLAEVEPLFVERWSPRSFDPDFRISPEQLESLMEAARWAPSCFNEQPWVIHLTLHGSPGFQKMLGTLAESNQTWAKNAAVLGYVVGKKKFKKNGKENSTYEYDCGAAWMSFTLQARMMGLYTHGMAGFSPEAAKDLLELNADEERVIAAFTIGKRDEPSKLPEPLRSREELTPRKDLTEVYKLHERF